MDSLLRRARTDAATSPPDELLPGDVVQLRPGIDRAWETSMILVTKVDSYKVRGQILRPHRGGCPEAWHRFRPGEVVRVGRIVYPEPPADVRAWCYEPPCPLLQRRPPARAGAPSPSFPEAQAIMRDHRAATADALTAELISITLEDNLVERRRTVRTKQFKTGT